MNVSTAQNITHYNYKTANKNNSQSDMNFSDYISHHRNKEQNIPNSSNEGVLIEMLSFPYDKSQVINIMEYLGLDKKPHGMTIDPNNPPPPNGTLTEGKAVHNYSNANFAIADGKEIPLANFGERISLLDYELDPKNWTNYFDDPNWVKQVQQGIMFREQYFDFTNAGDFDELTDKQDFTGMNDSEKYEAILEKYKHCYGDDFLKASSVSYSASGSSRSEIALRNFNNELRATFGSTEAVYKACRESQYGDMSDSAIRQTIREKYPPEGELTYLDLYHMANEMNQSGLGLGLTYLIDESLGIYMMKFGGMVNREDMLNLPVDKRFVETMRDYFNYKINANLPVNLDLAPTMNDIFK